MAPTAATIDLAPLGARSIVAAVGANNGGVGASNLSFVSDIFGNFAAVAAAAAISFFYPLFLAAGHGGVKRWTRRVDIFAHDFIVVPVHLGRHWCLAIVDLQNKAIRYCDSMGGNNMRCVRAIKEYLEDESMDKKKTPLNTSDWSLDIVKDIPQQINSSDCGVFTCKYADYLVRRKPITFTQEHMPYFRRRMVYEILTKQLL